MAANDVVLDKKVKQKIAEPKDWKVVLLNDDTTPMDFVTNVLVEIFNHTPTTAQEIMLNIHNKGSGIAGVYPFEIAESKTVETTTVARSNGFALQVKLEEV